MATWSISPSDGVTGSGPSFTFPTNTGATDIVYTITYTHDNGCTANTTYTVKAPSPSTITITSDKELTCSGGTITFTASYS